MSDKESDAEEVSLSSSEDDDTGEALDIKPPQKQAGRKIGKKKQPEKHSKHADSKRHHERHRDSRKDDRGARQHYGDSRRDRDHPRPREEPRRRDVEDLRMRLDRGRIDVREKEKALVEKDRMHRDWDKERRDRETSSKERHESRVKQRDEDVVILTTREREKPKSVEKEKHEKEKERHKDRDTEASEAERLEQEKRRKRLLAAAKERDKMQKEVETRREQERKEKEKERDREKEKEREREKEKEEKLKEKEKEKSRQSKKKKSKQKRSKHTSKKTRKRSETSVDEESSEDSTSSAATSSDDDSSSRSEETTSSEESETASSESEESEESQEVSSEDENTTKKKIQIIHEEKKKIEHAIEKKESPAAKRSRPSSPAPRRDEKRSRKEERSPKVKKETRSPRKREERSPRVKEEAKTPEQRQRVKVEEEEVRTPPRDVQVQSPMEDEEAEVDKLTPPPSPLPLKEELPPYLPAIMGCRSVEEFQCLNKIEEGTYGVVYRARDKRTNEIVALKRLKMEREKEGFPITSLREISTLLKAQHPNIVTVREIVVGSNMDKIFLVMDYVEHDIKALMETMKAKKQFFTIGEVKCLVLQLLAGVAHLHDNWIIHRDLKTSNLLLSHRGELKIGDFGLAREYGSPLKAYTSIVVTLWYRAPELLLGTKLYSTPIDVWSVGCIFGELVQMEPMFPGKSEVDEITKIYKELGTPNEEIWKGYSKLPAVTKMSFPDFPPGSLKQHFSKLIGESGLDLLVKLLTYDPVKRISAEGALKHPFFREPPLPISKDMFPTWPAKSELGVVKRAASPKPPSGGIEYKNLDNDDDVMGGRFFVGGGGVAQERRPPQGGGFSLKF